MMSGIEMRELLALPVMAGCFGMFMSGLPSALGAAASDVDDGLLGAFVMGSGWRMMMMKGLMVAAGFLYDTQRHRVRLMWGLSYAAWMIGMVLLALGLDGGYETAMYAGNLLLGAGMGFVYLLGTMTVASALDRRAGVAVVCIMTTYVMGIIVGTELLAVLCEVMTLPEVLILIAVVLCTVGAALALLAPPPAHPHDATEIYLDTSHDDRRTNIYARPELYMFLIVVGVSQGPAWAVINAFDALAVRLFGFSGRDAKSLFSALNVLKLSLVFVTGYLTDNLGANALTVFSMVSLLVSTPVLYLGTVAASKTVVVLGIVLHWAAMTIIATTAVLMAKEAFGEKQAATAFSLSKSVSGVFILVCSMSAANIVESPSTDLIPRFVDYCELVAAISVVGLVCALGFAGMLREKKRKIAELCEEAKLIQE